MKFRVTFERAIIGAAFCLLLLLLFLFPYSQPHSDDFSYNQFLLDQGYWPATKYVFTHNGGRFLATALLFLSPLSSHNIDAYPIVTAGLFLFFIAAIGFFSRVVAGRKKAFPFAALLFVCYLSFLPNLHELIYWLAGAATYLSAATLFLTLCSIHLLLARKDYENRQYLWLVAGTNALLICGCSEAGILLAAIPHGLHLLWRHSQKLPLGRIIALNILWLSTAFLIVLAPGSIHRHAQTPFSGQPILAIGGGLYVTAEWILRWGLSLLAAAAVYAALIAPFLKERSSWINRFLNLKSLLIFGLLFFIACQSAAVWMSGSVPEERFENLLFLYMLLYSFLAAQIWVNQQNSVPMYPLQVTSALLLIVAFCSLPQNFSKAVSDCCSGAAQRFDQQSKQRYALLTISEESVLKVPMISAAPDLLYYPSLSCDSIPDKMDVPRLAMAEYFGKKWIYEYPCRPEKQISSLKAFLKQKRKDWFSDQKQ